MPMEYKDETIDRISENVLVEAHDRTLDMPDITIQDKLYDAHNKISTLFEPKDRYVVISELKKTPEVYNRYIRLSDNLRLIA